MGVQLTADGFNIGTRQDGDTTTLSLEGEIDYGTVSHLRSALVDVANSPTSRLVIDLSDVTFLDSTTLSVLVQAKERFTEESRDMVVANASPRITRILEVSGVLELLQA